MRCWQTQLHLTLRGFDECTGSLWMIVFSNGIMYLLLVLCFSVCSRTFLWNTLNQRILKKGTLMCHFLSFAFVRLTLYYVVVNVSRCKLSLCFMLIVVSVLRLHYCMCIPAAYFLYRFGFWVSVFWFVIDFSYFVLITSLDLLSHCRGD